MSHIARELTTSYNPAPLASSSPPHEMVILAGLTELTVYTQTLRATLITPHHLDWWKAVCSEFDNCVWSIAKKSNVPKGRKIIGNG
jgi:purine nucleoside phosphorylase